MQPIFFFEGSSPEMLAAYSSAQASFKHFWRELSWERRRIVPALDLAIVKLPFTDGKRTDGNVEYEHMWVSDIDFDGETISGTLMNSPNWLASIKEGDAISAPFSHLEDWMMTADGVAYGAYTVNVMRSKMNSREMKSHDNAWGLDFGDPARTRVNLFDAKRTKPSFISNLFGQKREHSQVLSEHSHTDHPMCVSMIEKIEAQLLKDRALVDQVDSHGWTLLHKEALAGNFGVVKLLIQYGANRTAKTGRGKDAAELARLAGWDEIATYIVPIK